MATKSKNNLRKNWVKNLASCLIVGIIITVGIMGSSLVFSINSTRQSEAGREFMGNTSRIFQAIYDDNARIPSELSEKNEFLYYIEIENTAGQTTIYNNISKSDITTYLDKLERMDVPHYYCARNNNGIDFQMGGDIGLNYHNQSFFDLDQSTDDIRAARNDYSLEVTTIFFGFDESFWLTTFASDIDNHQIFEKELRNFLNITIISMVILLLLVLYLIGACGYDENNEKTISKIDNIYFEIRVVMLTVVFSIGILIFVELIEAFGEILVFNQMSEYVAFIALGTIIFLTSISVLGLLISLIRTWKHRQFMNKSFIGKTFSGVGTVAKTIEESLQPSLNKLKRTDEKLIPNVVERTSNRNVEKLYRQLLIFIGLEMLITILFILFLIEGEGVLLILITAAGIVIAYRSLQKLKLHLAIIETDIRTMATEQIKSERMKLDLITNVSHDLKTPLTSIISYSELLKEEKLSKVAKDYSQVIYDKANVLKSIVADLFDLSRATSGDIELELERIDYKKLIEQTIIEMQEQIDNKQIKLVTQFPKYATFIMGDGAKLHRALRNIIENALKYSIEGTRIFINLQIIEKQVNLQIINTANYEINFTGEEIVQRFVRGDEARSTEGSGLGLSIAKSFVEICGGLFTVYINGDQFIVDIVFKEALVRKENI